MFTTIDRVKEVTGYDVNQETVIMAQNIIETFIGRIEIDVTDPEDMSLLDRATAYQAAYMTNDPVKIFEQMNVQQISQFGAMIQFKYGDNASPFVAPLALMACSRLSWRRPRSLYTGRMFGGIEKRSWETD